jgi:MFS family permease
MMLIRAAFAGCATVAAMAFVSQPWQLLALRLVEGSLTGTVTAATVLVATTTPKARLGYALGLLQTAVFAGSSIGPLFGGVLADTIGPRPTFLVAGSMLGLAGLLTLLIVRERFEPPVPAPPSDAPAPTGRWNRVRGAAGPLLSGAVVTLVLALFVIRFAAMAVQPIVPLFVASLAPAPPIPRRSPASCSAPSASPAPSRPSSSAASATGSATARSCSPASPPPACSTCRWRWPATRGNWPPCKASSASPPAAWCRPRTP